MIQFLIKRFIGLLFVITGVTFITFMLGYVAPGDPIRNLFGPARQYVDRYREHDRYVDLVFASSICSGYFRSSDHRLVGQPDGGRLACRELGYSLALFLG